MAYRLVFFCKGAEEDSAAGAMDRVLDTLLETGPPLLGEYRGPPEPRPGERLEPDIDAVHSFRLVTGTEQEGPTPDYLLLEIRAGVRFIAEDVIAADPDDDHGVWGSELMAIVTLTGARPDWPLVDRIWTVLESLWSAVLWDETSGFAVAAETRRPLRGDISP
ncbi:hypothetical protein BJF79_11705 [Actinomadura sp. CNU-125]|uniref:hypothetical protein n=1 Tax=Actinomadura sp. CNU-125 TaxID=1904961 RepID=UPI000968D721|nr:hypothetical protein [Actinomadura sp. CNU-125]OLT27529.1 hypothetical protein BJF79_11705 [Actinomadura sp. CNU-125]